MRPKLCLIMMCLSLLGCEGNALTWDSTFELIDEDFPSVRQLSIEDFLQGYLDSSLVVDARDPKEFTVSHIKGAINLVDAKKVIDISKSRKLPQIIVYCSVGYRSSKLADEIMKAGFRNVYNLKGSIFDWVNRGLPVYDAEGKTNVVHPYDEKWGELLDEKYHPP